MIDEKESYDSASEEMGENCDPGTDGVKVCKDNSIKQQNSAIKRKRKKTSASQARYDFIKKIKPMMDENREPDQSHRNVRML